MTKDSMRQHAKAHTTIAAKQKSAGNSMQCSNVKAPTKKAIKNQKWPALECNDDTSLDKKLREQHPHKKTKHGRHEADADIEEVGDTEEFKEVEEVNDDEASVSEKVSY
jgi:hypothetical protein